MLKVLDAISFFHERLPFACCPTVFIWANGQNEAKNRESQVERFQLKERKFHWKLVFPHNLVAMVQFIKSELETSAHIKPAKRS